MSGEKSARRDLSARDVDSRLIGAFGILSMGGLWNNARRDVSRVAAGFDSNKQNVGAFLMPAELRPPDEVLYQKKIVFI